MKPRANANTGPPLSELTVDGLLSFGSSTTFRFERLNLLVGPNGCGKSNLIDTVRVLQSAPTNIQAAFSDVGFEEWLYKTPTGQPKSQARIAETDPGRPPGTAATGATAVVEAHIEIPGLRALRHRLELGPPLRSAARLDELVELRDPYPGYDAPIFLFKGQHGRPVLNYWQEDEERRKPQRLSDDEFNPLQSILAQVRDSVREREITRLAQLYSSIRVYSDWSFGRSSPLRESATADRTETTMSESMGDLALALNALQGTAAHDSIRRYLHELKASYADYVTRVLFGRVGLELREQPFPRPVPAKRLSDGTLRFLALAAILLNPDPPPIICIEEPELGMHPDMVRMVAEMLLSASSRAQLIVTTHSEELLTALQDDFNVLFAFNWGAEGTVVRRLSQQEYSDFRADHALGDLWTSGEIGGVRW